MRGPENGVDFGEMTRVPGMRSGPSLSSSDASGGRSEGGRELRCVFWRVEGPGVGEMSIASRSLIGSGEGSLPGCEKTCSVSSGVG